MGRYLTPLRALLAMLCVALAVVFAGASAASVVDRVEHATHAQHEHVLNLSFGANDDHGTVRGSAAHHHGDGDAGDHQPGAGHHHADAPTGALSQPSTASHAAIVVEVVAPTLEPAAAGGVRPGGLERPPKDIANPV